MLIVKFLSQTVPGSVTNHKYYKKNGIVLEWGKPVNANGNLLHYLIQWTIENTTHSEKIDYHSEKDRNVFKVRIKSKITSNNQDAIDFERKQILIDCN